VGDRTVNFSRFYWQIIGKCEAQIGASPKSSETVWSSCGLAQNRTENCTGSNSNSHYLGKSLVNIMNGLEQRIIIISSN